MTTPGRAAVQRAAAADRLAAAWTLIRESQIMRLLGDRATDQDRRAVNEARAAYVAKTRWWKAVTR
jgi:hypothetical protein